MKFTYFQINSLLLVNKCKIVKNHTVLLSTVISDGTDIQAAFINILLLFLKLLLLLLLLFYQ